MTFSTPFAVAVIGVGGSDAVLGRGGDPVFCVVSGGDAVSRVRRLVAGSVIAITGELVVSQRSRRDVFCASRL